MTAAALREVLANLLTGQRLAVLATRLDRGTYANLVAFAATSDLKEILFATSRATRKFANLMATPQVSLLMDNRSNQATDFQEASAEPPCFTGICHGLCHLLDNWALLAPTVRRFP